MAEPRTPRLCPKGVQAWMPLRTASGLLDKLRRVGIQDSAEAFRFLSSHSQTLACGRDLRWH